MNAITSLWARSAMVWFLITVGFGMFMGMTQQFQYAPAHAHMGVLGWLSSAVFALIYAVSRPWANGAKLPRWHWGAHNLGVAVMTGALFLEMRDPEAGLAPAIAAGALIVVVSAVWMVAMNWRRLTPEPVAAE
ncbi:MAG TPA: hypothetical protein VF727_15010 [Allosphingosinicella sp.]